MKNILFIDRDGTLIIEPEDFQIDSLEKLELVPNVIPVLLELKKMGYLFVMVSNQDGLGTESYPLEDFEVPHQKMLHIFESQGITFEDQLICPHFDHENCNCRKPKPGLLKDYLGKFNYENTYVIGDRDTDVELAENIGTKFFKITDNFGWNEILDILKSNGRNATVTRKTKETSIEVVIDLDKKGQEISTGIGFFDHMLDQISSHGGFYLKAIVKGDLEIDDHHTVEDTGIAFGEALSKALGNKSGIGRFGFLLPMDETQCQIALDLSGRSYFVFEGVFNREKVGELSTEMVPHFFRSVAESLKATLQIKVHGENTHHQVESCFKGFGRVLRQAVHKEVGIEGVPSTKGVL